MSTGVTRRPTAVATAMPTVKAMPVRSSGLTARPRRSTSRARTGGVSNCSVSSSVWSSNMAGRVKAMGASSAALASSSATSWSIDGLAGLAPHS